MAWRFALRVVYPVWQVGRGIDARLGHRAAIRDMKRDWNARATQDARHFIALDSGHTEAEFAHSGERDVAQLVEPRISTLLPTLNPKDAQVLEIGCGTGRMTRPLSRLFGHVIAVDVSEEMISRARSSLADLSGRKTRGSGRFSQRRGSASAGAVRLQNRRELVRGNLTCRGCTLAGS
jgi:SAM-dependent methyltransferase